MTDAVPERAEELLTSEPLMVHLATSVDDRPHVAPVWYEYDDGVVEVLTGGRKLRDIRENARVALSVQKDTDGDAEWMVALHGTATVVEDEAATRDATARINEKYGASEDAYDENVLVRIAVGSAHVSEY
ncbi:Pyridoxamine 5'-phosphate oxidase [Natronoarchaeum philippinense]|uniref:Pyridoxamine 5'-phosphate oxidase n=1 Tax=Natronoarchaeum philippinense TaxID=558529 RepID=A0A285N9B1_NATPI|nr:pyridoxamine 5'-phosphate oxidase family protein [Natronoarchaeum philippinense]SNZ06019.1 Pyridoxamine 5'-phosphate oxidase [Natronoarchaeum philippinense]